MLAGYTAALGHYSSDFYEAVGEFVPFETLRKRFPKCCSASRSSIFETWTAHFDIPNTCGDMLSVTVLVSGCASSAEKFIGRPERACAQK
jgi:hypothetical protein